MGAAPHDPPPPGEPPPEARPAGEPEPYGPLLVRRFVKRDDRALILYERDDAESR
jgi:hypothetical protein